MSKFEFPNWVTDHTRYGQASRRTERIPPMQAMVQPWVVFPPPDGSLGIEAFKARTPTALVEIQSKQAIRARAVEKPDKRFCGDLSVGCVADYFEEEAHTGTMIGLMVRDGLTLSRQDEKAWHDYRTSADAPRFWDQTYGIDIREDGTTPDGLEMEILRKEMLKPQTWSNLFSELGYSDSIVPFISSILAATTPQYGFIMHPNELLSSFDDGDPFLHAWKNMDQIPFLYSLWQHRLFRKLGDHLHDLEDRNKLRFSPGIFADIESLILICCPNMANIRARYPGIFPDEASPNSMFVYRSMADLYLIFQHGYPDPSGKVRSVSMLMDHNNNLTVDSMPYSGKVGRAYRTGGLHQGSPGNSDAFLEQRLFSDGRLFSHTSEKYFAGIADEVSLSCFTDGGMIAPYPLWLRNRAGVDEDNFTLDYVRRNRGTLARSARRPQVPTDGALRDFAGRMSGMTPKKYEELLAIRDLIGVQRPDDVTFVDGYVNTES